MDQPRKIEIHETLQKSFFVCLAYFVVEQLAVKRIEGPQMNANANRSGRASASAGAQWLVKGLVTRSVKVIRVYLRSFAAKKERERDNHDRNPTREDNLLGLSRSRLHIYPFGYFWPEKCA